MCTRAIKGYSMPLLEIDNYLCEQDLELKLFTQKTWRSNFRNYCQCKCTTSHHWEGNGCVPFHLFSWFCSDWFFVFRLSLTIQLLFGSHNSFIDGSRISDNTITSITHQETMWAPFDSHPLRCDMSSHPIRLFIGFSMLVQFPTIQLSLTLWWLENKQPP